MFRSECENRYIRVVSKTMITSGNENGNENNVEI